MTRYRNRTSDDIGRNWRQSIIRFAGLDPDGKLVPLPPRPPPEDMLDPFAANDRDAALRRALKWTWQ
jgi:hypothetical protein